MHEFLENRVEKRFIVEKDEGLIHFLKSNFQEKFYKEGLYSKIISIYFNNENILDNNISIRSRIYVNDMKNYGRNIDINDLPCEIQIKAGDSKHGIYKRKCKCESYNRLLTRLSCKNDNSLDKDKEIFDEIFKLSKGKSFFPYMKIYYERRYFEGIIDNNTVRITLDDKIVFENCSNSKNIKYNKLIMEVKMNNKYLDDSSLTIKNFFKNIELKDCQSKKLIGHELLT